MQRIWSTAVAVAMLTGLVACGGGEPPADMEEMDHAPAAADAAAPAAAMTGDLPEGVSPELVAQGKEIFGSSGICFTCHGADGTGGMLAPSFTDSEWLNIDGEYESIVEVVKTGVATPKEFPGMMPARAGVNLTDEQVEAVAAYVFALSRTD